MKKVEVPIVPRALCETELRKTRLGDKFILHESFICAGGQTGGQDTCTGDGGSPVNNSDRFISGFIFRFYIPMVVIL
jgi:kallikrein